MKTRLLPYATTPGRALLQAGSDVLVVLWGVLWYFVGTAVHAAISAFAAVGRQVEGGATGIAGNLDSAGRNVGEVPLVGDPVSKPLTAAGNAARTIAEAGAGLDEKATLLAWILAFAVAVPPVLAVAMPWLFLRLRFARRAGAAVALAGTPAGEELLALRALAGRPLPQLARISDDPVQAWRENDDTVVRALAAMELRAAGLSTPRAWRKGLPAARS